MAGASTSPLTVAHGSRCAPRGLAVCDVSIPSSPLEVLLAAYLALNQRPFSAGFRRVVDLERAAQFWCVPGAAAIVGH